MSLHVTFSNVPKSCDRRYCLKCSLLISRSFSLLDQPSLAFLSPIFILMVRTFVYIQLDSHFLILLILYTNHKYEFQKEYTYLQNVTESDVEFSEFAKKFCL